MTIQTATLRRTFIKERFAALGSRIAAGVVSLGFVVSTFAAVATGPVVSAATVPAPSDSTVTPYGSVGKWMLKLTGQVADYGGQKYQGKTLLEPVNVIIVDQTSKSTLGSVLKVDARMSAAGFPSRIGHSAGFKGMINDKKYGQKPSSLVSAYSDDSFLARNNHGRLFGPAPLASGGYVYSGAFSTEIPVWKGLLPTHAYVSSNEARDALAQRLTAKGNIREADADLGNAYNVDVTTTGDHDGKAVVIVLK